MLKNMRIRAGLLSMFVCMCAVPAHAVTLLSEGWEGTCGEIQARWDVGSWYTAANGGFPCGYGYFNTVAEQPYFLDTSVKLLGSQSLRFNFTGTQYDTPKHGGGYTDKNFSQPSSEIWITIYYRMASGFQTGGAIGAAGTKGQYQFMRSSTRCVLNSNPFSPVACGSPGASLQINGWVFAYVWGSRELWMGAQGIKDAAIPYDSQWLKHNVQSYNQPFDKWVCYEAHIKLNSPGQANGLYEQYATNVTDNGPTILTSRYVNREFLGATTNDTMPSDAQWYKSRTYRQDGLGTMWMDGLTYSTTRIGCTGGGNTTPPDSQAPAGPRGLVAN